MYMNMIHRLKQQKSQTMATTPNLPPEIIEEILTWVPAKPLVRFRCISKHYQTLLTSPNFVQKHLSRAIQNDENHSYIIQTMSSNDEFCFFISDGALTKALECDSSAIGYDPSMVGCSNGLVCFSHEHYSNHGTVITLWNPFIGEYKKLPHPNIQIKPPLDEIVDAFSLGFGFHPAINEYKVVRFVDFEDRNSTCDYTMVEVYSLSTNSWRMVGKCPYLPSETSSEVTMNGAIHWIAQYGHTPVNANELIAPHGSTLAGVDELILAFDMAEDKFFEVPMPKKFGDAMVFLQVFKRCLSLFVGTKWPELDVWMMKEYGVKESWTHLFRVERQTIERPMGFLKNGDIMLKGKTSALVSYNSNSRESKIVQIPGIGKDHDFFAVEPYVESLALLAHNQAVD